MVESYEAAQCLNVVSSAPSIVAMSMHHATYRALIVDDEDGIRSLGKLALSRHGFVCDCAPSGQEAMAYLGASHYDLVVTDLRMANGHGHALCTHILSRTERPVLVVLTGVLEQRLAEDLKAREIGRASGRERG